MRLAEALLALAFLPHVAHAADAGAPAAGAGGAAASASVAEPFRGAVKLPDGTPVAGATVSVVDVPWDWEPALAGKLESPRELASALTGTDGSFAIVQVPAGMHALRLAVPGRVPLTRLDERVRFADGAPRPSLTLTPLPEVSLEGLALDELGAPVAGARLRLIVTSPLGAGAVDARADEHGRVRVDGLPALAQVRWLARAGSSQADGRAVLPAGGLLRVPLHLRKDVEIAGRVLLASAEPRPVVGGRIVTVLVPGARRSFGSLPELGRSGMPRVVVEESLTAADGSFRVALPEGAQAVLAAPGLPLTLLRAGETLLRPSEDTLLTVVDAAGKPVPGARVVPEIVPIAELTDARGQARLPFMSDTVTVTSPAGARTSTPLRHGPLRVTLPEPATIAMTLRSPPAEGSPEGAPMPGATVRLALGDDRQVVLAAGDDGTFTATLPRRPTRIAASGMTNGTATDMPAPTALAGSRELGSPERGATWVVPAAGRIAINAGPDPKAEPGSAWALVRDVLRPHDVRVVQVPPSGLIAEGAEGPHRVVLVRRGFEVASEGITATRSGARQEIDALPAATLRIRCVDSEGKPIEGAAVTVAAESLRRREAAAFREDRRATPPLVVASGPDGDARQVGGASRGRALDPQPRRHRARLRRCHGRGRPARRGPAHARPVGPGRPARGHERRRERVARRRRAAARSRGSSLSRASTLHAARRASGTDAAPPRSSRMRVVVLVAGLLLLMVAGAPAALAEDVQDAQAVQAVQANTGTTRIDFTPREWVDVGLSVNGVTVDRLKLHPPGKMTSLMVKHDEANRGKIVISNGTDVVISPSIAIAVFDAEGRLLGAANTGARNKSIKPGKSEDLEIHFGGVFRHLARGSVLYVSLEY